MNIENIRKPLGKHFLRYNFLVNHMIRLIKMVTLSNEGMKDEKAYLQQR